MKSKSYRPQIAIAIIGLVGVLGAAVFSNWDRLFPSSNHATPMEKPFSQSSTAPNSPNVANVQGDVNINIKGEQSKLDVPSFNLQITGPQQAEAFEQFVDKNRGKLVHINVAIAESYSEIDENYLGVSTTPCSSPYFFTYCLEVGLVIEGGDYELGWYKGENRLSGFFVIDENVEMHQGMWYVLKSVPRETVLLQTQRVPR